jgi:hypothetical protein
LDFLAAPGTWTFYNLREEAQFLADVIKAAPRNERVLWGFDREIFNDRYLISKLEARVPRRARVFYASEGGVNKRLGAVGAKSDWG